MSTEATPPEMTSPPSRIQKGPRVLACALCAQRKIRCDRKFPCANCTKSRAQCVPTTLVPRERKRRFPERKLLERLRMYEDLLRQHQIAFEPLHKDTAANPPADHDDDSDGLGLPTPATTARSERSYEVKSVLSTMRQGLRDHDNDSDSSEEDGREILIRSAWEQSLENPDHLLFGSRVTGVNLSTLHPDPVQIFRLWQVYLDNVNPLLKVTHTPTLQGRIIDAASHVSDIDRTLEALMFSIYCMAIHSLTNEQCASMFGTPREDLLTRYRFGCQQALLNCQFLRTGDRDCLTALFLYLVAVRPDAVPQSMHSMLGVAIRIAHRMGIHSESALSKCSVFEAEMRRRLWWPLVLFDSRNAQLASSKTVTLDPTWDCKVPLNVNDSDLHPDMKELPTVYTQPSEAIFAVVRSEMADFIRHAEFNLEFTTPSLKPLAKHVQSNPPSPSSGADNDMLLKLETMIEDQYLKSCALQNPIHFMTIWTTRSHLARCRLMDQLSRHSSSSCVRWVDTQRDAVLLHALTMLHCDTKAMVSPLTKNLRWFNHTYFPFLAYVHAVGDLKTRSMSSELAQRAWDAMSDNYKAWADALTTEDSTPIFRIFATIILDGWRGACDAAVAAGETVQDPPPRIVAAIHDALARQVDVSMATSDDADLSSGAFESDGFSADMSLPVTSMSSPNFPTLSQRQEQQQQQFPMGMHDPTSSSSSPVLHMREGLLGPGAQSQDMFSIGGPGTAMADQSLINVYQQHPFDWPPLGGWPAWGGF